MLRDEHARRRGCRAHGAREHGFRAARASRPRRSPSQNGVVSGGGKSVKLRRPDGRQDLQHHDRRGQARADRAGALPADRQARPADRHPGDRHRHRDLHPERARSGDAARPRRPPARAGGADRRGDAALARPAARSRTSRTCRSCRRATSSASSRRSSGTRSRRRRAEGHLVRRADADRRRQPRTRAPRPGQPAAIDGRGRTPATSERRSRRPRRSCRRATSGPTSCTARSARTARSPTSAAAVGDRALHGPGPVLTRAGGRGARSGCRRRRSASRSSAARATTATTPTTTSASPRRCSRKRSASRCGCSSCAGTSTAGISSAPPRRPTSVPGIDAGGKIVAYDYTAFNHGWTQVVESSAPARRERRCPRSPRPERIDTVSSGSFYDDPEPPRHQQERQRLRPVPEGHLPARTRRAAGALRLRADDRRARPCGEHGPDRVPDPEHRRHRRQRPARWIAVLDAVAEAAELEAEGLRVELWRAATSSRAAASRSAASRTRSRRSSPTSPSTGRPARSPSTTSTRPRTPAPRSTRPRSRTRSKGCLVQGTSRALLEEVRFTRVRQTSLDWVTYPILRFKDAPAVTTVVVQRLDQPSAGSGEPTTAAVAGRDRERLLRRHRRPALRAPMSPATCEAHWPPRPHRRPLQTTT